MSVSIVQACDSCSRTRTVTSSEASSLTLGGWREVKLDKHICAQCINELLAPKGEKEA